MPAAENGDVADLDLAFQSGQRVEQRQAATGGVGCELLAEHRRILGDERSPGGQREQVRQSGDDEQPGVEARTIVKGEDQQESQPAEGAIRVGHDGRGDASIRQQHGRGEALFPEAEITGHGSGDQCRRHHVVAAGGEVQNVVGKHQEQQRQEGEFGVAAGDAHHEVEREQQHHAPEHAERAHDQHAHAKELEPPGKPHIIKRHGGIDMLVQGADPLGPHGHD